MRFTQVACAAALSAVVYATPSPANNNAGGSTGTTLSADAIQSGSFVDGSQEIGAAEVGQALSATSRNNFINNCAGKTLTNGFQITTGSCNGITMGDIPAKSKMVSSIITFPTTGGKDIVADTDFNITVQMSNLVAGSFTNADATYYAAPQALSGGVVVGHTHVTVQDMGKSLNPTTALDPTQFAFFKGINDAGNGKGLLTAVVTGGLPAGNYRVCTMASASNHQPVLMPVAQRGTADDCTKFTVSGNGNTPNAASNTGAKGIAAAALAESAIANGAGNPDPALTAATKASAASSVEASTTTKKGGAKAVATEASSSAETTTTKKGGKNNAAATEASSVASSVETSTTKKGGKAAAVETSSAVASVETSATKKGAKAADATSVAETTTKKGGKAAAVETTTSQAAKASKAASGGNGGASFGNGQPQQGGQQGGGRGRGQRIRRQFIA